MANIDGVEVDLHILKSVEQDLVLLAMTNADWEKFLVGLASSPNFKLIPPSDESMFVKRINITVEK